MHAALDAGDATQLERDARLALWLRAVIARRSTSRSPAPRLGERDARALRLAGEYLAETLDRNVGLDELAAAAGVGKFRLIRLMRARTGLTPHALQLALRLQAARRRLEHGASIAETAIATGFSDQSHLHRQFVRSLGLTPGAYRRCFTEPRSLSAVSERAVGVADAVAGGGEARRLPGDQPARDQRDDDQRVERRDPGRGGPERDE